MLQLLSEKYSGIMSMVSNSKQYLRLLGACREDLHDFPLVRGRFYNFAEEDDDQLQDKDSSKSNILWAFQRINKVIDQILSSSDKATAFAELSKEIACGEPEEDDDIAVAR